MPASQIIRFGTKEDVSHVAVMFEQSSTVFHSHITGIHRTKKNRFLSKYRVLYHVPMPFLSETESDKVLQMFDSIVPEETYYNMDFWRFFAAAIVRRIDGKPFPREMMWMDDEGYLSTELAYTARSIFKRAGIELLHDDLGEIVMPGVFYETLRLRVIEMIENSTILGIEEKALLLTSGMARRIF